MNLPILNVKPLCSALILASLLSACGGGGGGGSDAPTAGTGTGNTQGGPSPAGGGGAPTSEPPVVVTPPASGPPLVNVPSPGPVAAPMTMSCVEGAGVQCSGAEVLKRENGVALTRSGVQVYGISTSDLVKPITEPGLAFGLAPSGPTSRGVAEFRLAKDAGGAVSKPALLLRDLGLTWDSKTERPPIIDLFDKTQGRVVMDANGNISSIALPPTTDLTFYDYADKGTAGTQANYANNRYFPRGPDNPPRCAQPQECTTETIGPVYKPGSWRTGERTPDWSSAVRLHGEGDVHAGNGKPNNGNPTWLAGGSGFGVPFPGSKGYRGFENWSYTYGNLGTWITQDTVQIHEWGATDEHTKIRRGIVAFGDVTNPSTVPSTGTASYSGIAYGWHSSNGKEDPAVFWGAAVLTVDFATRNVHVSIQNTQTYNAAGTPVAAASFNADTKMGAAGEGVANYLTGTVNNGTVQGGVSGRYFGPGTGGPAEVGGAFTLSNAGTGQTVVGGFIARRQ
ncbi:MAG: hypothetical protein JWM42_2228 [Burkholderia sp.]|nr:hypothetical protein [Burkholderia sp.]